MKILWWRRLLSLLAGKIFYLIFSRHWLLNPYSRYFPRLFFIEINCLFFQGRWTFDKTWNLFGSTYWVGRRLPLNFGKKTGGVSEQIWGRLANGWKMGPFCQVLEKFWNYFESVKKIIFQQFLFKTRTSDRSTSSILGWSSRENWKGKTNFEMQWMQ